MCSPSPHSQLKSRRRNVFGIMNVLTWSDQHAVAEEEMEVDVGERAAGDGSVRMLKQKATRLQFNCTCPGASCRQSLVPGT